MPLVLFIEWNVFLQKINSPIYCVLLASFTVTLTKENQKATQGSLKRRGRAKSGWKGGVRKTKKKKEEQLEWRDKEKECQHLED